VANSTLIAINGNKKSISDGKAVIFEITQDLGAHHN